MKVIGSLIKILQILEQENLNFFRPLKKGYSISSNQILRGISRYCDSLRTVIDVGANQGQFALATTKIFPNARIISFEPLPELYTAFKKNLKNFKNVSIHNAALGDSKGMIDFYKNEHSHASSALVISEEQKAAIPKTAKATKIQVAVDRLDDVLAGTELSKPILLKLDVQGFEKNVLEGAPKLLTKIDYLVFEASFVHMYQGEPLFEEMHSFLKEKGFDIVAPVGFLEGKNKAILQMDFLYKNRKAE